MVCKYVQVVAWMMPPMMPDNRNGQLMTSMTWLREILHRRSTTKLWQSMNHCQKDLPSLLSCWTTLSTFEVREKCIRVVDQVSSHDGGNCGVEWITKSGETKWNETVAVHTYMSVVSPDHGKAKTNNRDTGICLKFFKIKTIKNNTSMCTTL